MPMPTSVHRYRSMPDGASPEPPRSSEETSSLKVRSSIIQSVIGRKASAASTADTIRPW